MHRAARYLLILPVLIGLFLLFYDLGERPVWSDEYFTWSVVFDGGFPSRVLTDIHPPLYYIAALGFTHWTTDNLLMLRLLSVICGIGSILIAFILCRRYFGRVAGDVFLILMPLNCHFILFSKMGRYYAPLMLLVLLAQLAFDRVTARRGWGNVILYAITLTLCFYTNLVSLLIIPAHLMAVLLRRKSFGYVFAGQLYALAALMGWVPVILKQLSAKGSMSPFATDIPFNLMGFAARVLWPIYDFSFGENIEPWNAVIVIPGLIAILVAFVWFLIRGTYRLEFAGYLIWVLIPLAALTGLLLPVGIEFLPSRAMFLLPFWLMLIAAGISRMPRQVMPIPVIILVAVSLIGNYQYMRYAGTVHSTYIMPWDEISAEADRLAGDDGIIIADDESMAFYLPDDSRLKFLSTLEDPERLLQRHLPIVLVINPRDLTPGGMLKPFLDLLSDEGYRESKTLQFLIEDENSLRFKTRLLGREVSRAKKEVRKYLPN